MKIRKIITILIILLLITTSISKATFSINKADLYSKGRCKPLLRLASNGGEIIVTKVFYKNNGKENPAYCVNKELGGVGEYGSYSVSIDSALAHTEVRKGILNGYPYKSLASLGVADEDEAYTATKQAVYCLLYGDDTSKYIPIGEAGTRTLNAMKKIIETARTINMPRPSTNIKIQEATQWEIDETNKTYISKTMEIKTEFQAKEYIISIADTKENKIKITDMNNKEIKTTKEKRFKIKMPINLLEKDGEIDINIKAELATYPVLYGKANNAGYQNYALTGEIYEAGDTQTKVKYNKNKTKLKIIKKDDKTKKLLEGVEFNILNEKGEIKYSNLKTNKDGEIIVEGMQPGKYYLEEVASKQGYQKLEGKIEFEIKLNEELAITVTNKQEEITPKEEIIPKKEQSYSEQITKLPVTGM